MIKCYGVCAEGYVQEVVPSRKRAVGAEGSMVLGACQMECKP